MYFPKTLVLVASQVRCVLHPDYASLYGQRMDCADKTRYGDLKRNNVAHRSSTARFITLKLVPYNDAL
jgi:hypothetical protein